MDADEIIERLDAVRERIRARLDEERPPRLADDLGETPPLALDELRPSRPSFGARAPEREHLRRANELAQIGAPIELTSDVPILGPLVNLVRRVLAPLIRPFIDPYVDRQERFNAEVVRHLNALGESIEARLGEVCDLYLDLARDPRLLEARLDAALTDYDTVLRGRHTLLFDALEEEIWALRALIRDRSGEAPAPGGASGASGADHGTES